MVSPSQSVAAKNLREFLSRYIDELVTETIDVKKMSEELARFTQELGVSAPQEIAQLSSFIKNLIVLCQGLYDEPLRVTTGKKRLVKRIQPHITYLTHESEKSPIRAKPSCIRNEPTRMCITRLQHSL